MAAAGAKLRHYILHHHASIPVHVEEINLSLARIAMGSGVDLNPMDGPSSGRAGDLYVEIWESFQAP